MTNPTPPFKVQKFRERWERIDRTTGETAAAGWSGGALYRITHADKTVGIFSTGTDKIDPAPPHLAGTSWSAYRYSTTRSQTWTLAP